MVHPGDVDTLKRQLKELPEPLSEPERASYSREAVNLLSRLARDSKGPLTADLNAAESALAIALSTVETAQQRWQHWAMSLTLMLSVA